MSMFAAAREILGPSAVERFTVEPYAYFLTWAAREPPSHFGVPDEYAPWTEGEVVRLAAWREDHTRLDLGDAFRQRQDPPRGMQDLPYLPIEMRKKHDCYFNAEDFSLRVHPGMSLADALHCEQAIARFARPMYMRVLDLLRAP